MSRLLLEYTLQEVAPGDALVKQIAYEFADLFEQYKNEGIILSEGEIGNTQLKSIFKDAAKVTQGKKIERGQFRKAFDQGVRDGEAAGKSIKGGAEVVGKAGNAIKGGVLATAQGAAKLNKKMDDLVKKYEGTEGVTKFNDKADKAMAKIGDKIRTVKGGDKSLAVLKKLGEWGKENPGKQAIVLGALAAIGGFMSGGAIPAVAVPIYKAVTAGAAGDKLTTILAKAAKGAALGAVAGAAGEAISGGIADALEGLDEQQLAEIKQDMLAAARKGSIDDIEAAYGDVIPELDAGRTYSVRGHYNRYNYNFNVYVPEDEISEFKSLAKAFNDADDFSPEQKTALGKWHNFLKGLENDPTNKDMYDASVALRAARRVGLSAEDIEGLDIAEKTLADKTTAIKDAVKNAKSGVENAAYSRGSDSKTLDRNN